MIFLFNNSSIAIFMAKLGLGQGGQLFQSIVLAFVVLLDSNLSRQPILPPKVQLTALCSHKVFHPQEANSTQTPAWKQEAAMALLTHACFFVFFFSPEIQFSRLPFGLTSSYSHRKVQFFFCLDFSCSSHGKVFLIF